MSQKMMFGWWSLIFESASKPSCARMTWQPAWFRKISALRRMVFESSITITFLPRMSEKSAGMSPVPRYTTAAPRAAIGPRARRTQQARNRGRYDRPIFGLYRSEPCVAAWNTAVPGSDFDHFEIFLAGAALRAGPVRRKVLPLRPRRDALVRQPRGLVVDPAANQAHPGLRRHACRHLPGKQQVSG